jgi:hypothetical protein
MSFKALVCITVTRTNLAVQAKHHAASSLICEGKFETSDSAQRQDLQRLKRLQQ